MQDDRGFQPKIDNAVFPALQGGPHEHQIAGIATQLHEAMKPEFKEYIQQVRRRGSRSRGKCLQREGSLVATLAHKVCAKAHFAAPSGGRVGQAPLTRVGRPLLRHAKIIGCTQQGQKQDCSALFVPA